jgi:hypothetical protein
MQQLTAILETGSPLLSLRSCSAVLQSPKPSRRVPDPFVLHALDAGVEMGSKAEIRTLEYRRLRYPAAASYTGRPPEATLGPGK